MEEKNGGQIRYGQARGGVTRAGCGGHPQGMNPESSGDLRKVITSGHRQLLLISKSVSNHTISLVQTLYRNY
jgi:hypothetical protein